MTFELPKLTDLETESDVEQKLIFPFLVADQPFGLGISPSEILTKKDIRRLSIGKGKQRKSYFPDYLVLIGGLPLVVIEAKDPNADLDEGFREARLYAAEVNAIFQPGLNPLTKVIAINGSRILAGDWDHVKPQISMSYPELTVSSEKMAALHAMIDRDVLQKNFVALSGSIKPKRLWKPRRMNGGPTSQDEEISHNTFGATISAEFAHIFNPTTIEDRVRIARTAYIPSKRRERYVDPIDKVIRASRPPSETSSLLIEDTASPREILQKFETPRQLEHQVLLIVGGVGVGKTTFIDHLQYAALPKDLIDMTVWVRINMNFAPVSSNEIYSWLRQEIIAGCRSTYPDIDFDTLKTLKAVFSVEVRRFDKGIGQLYKDDQNLYNEKLGETLQQLFADLHQKAVAHTRYCSTERGKLLILVVDNCDKRTLDQQLLMFEAAQWIQKEFRALVILPLREETYDNHRDKPPLDTALKDLVFRIEPPLFHQVLVSRVQMALNEINQSGAKTFRYELPNGFLVEYPQSDKAYYLTSIVHAIFEHDRQIRRIILGLSGRNIRRALEMFLEFCTSGHITEDYIFKIRQAQGKYLLPLYQVERVLLRMNRRYYDSDHSYVKNLFAIDSKDTRPSHFSRLILLRWLFGKFSQQSGTSVKGYFPISLAIEELGVYGLEASIIRREVEYLTKAHCIISEDFREESLTDQDLIRLSPAGFVHLDLLNSVTYLAAVAEDTWFYSEDAARPIANRIRSTDTQYQADTAIANARDVFQYLATERETAVASMDAIFGHAIFEQLTDLSAIPGAIDALERSLTSAPWIGAYSRFPAKSTAVGTVVNVRDFGVFVELEPGISGLIPVKRLPVNFMTLEQFAPGERLTIEIVSVNAIKKRIEMSYIGPAPKEPLSEIEQLALDIFLPLGTRPNPQL
jgi:Type I restriction enzyme R protein N terminus (HSDR_N)/S1 RNA binding domain